MTVGAAPQGGFERHLFEQFVKIAETQSGALASLAERERQETEMLGKIVDSQRAIAASLEAQATLAERITSRLDHMDAEADARTKAAIDTVKTHVTLAAQGMSLEVSRSDRWTKVLVALLGFVGALLGTMVVLATRGG